MAQGLPTDIILEERLSANISCDKLVFKLWLSLFLTKKGLVPCREVEGEQMELTLSVITYGRGWV